MSPSVSPSDDSTVNLSDFPSELSSLITSKNNPGEPSAVHSLRPSIMLSFNTSKGPSLINSEVYYDIPKPSSFPSFEKSAIPIIVFSMRPSGSTSDVLIGNILDFPSGLSTLMHSHFHSG